MTPSDDNWLKKEFARVRERSAGVPPHARPVVTGGRKTASDPGYYYTTERVNYFIVICPLCGQRVQLDVFVESWTRLDEDAVSRARISVPSVHACTGAPEGEATE